MTTGMLWFDNDKKTPLAQKIVAAATYYRDKYGQVPNRCEVHPAEGLPEKVGVIEIIPRQYILPNHLLIGVNREE